MNSASTPTSRHHRASVDTSSFCMACPIEVVSLTRLPRAAVLAAVSVGRKQRVCAAATSRQYLGLRRLLVVAALCAWQSALGQAASVPAPLPE
nr:hypothetical protein [Tanacetum cinerariifolium]